MPPRTPDYTPDPKGLLPEPETGPIQALEGVAENPQTSGQKARRLYHLWFKRSQGTISEAEMAELAQLEAWMPSYFGWNAAEAKSTGGGESSPGETDTGTGTGTGDKPPNTSPDPSKPVVANPVTGQVDTGGGGDDYDPADDYHGGYMDGNYAGGSVDPQGADHLGAGGLLDFVDRQTGGMLSDFHNAGVDEIGGLAATGKGGSGWDVTGAGKLTGSGPGGGSSAGGGDSSGHFSAPSAPGGTYGGHTPGTGYGDVGVGVSGQQSAEAGGYGTSPGGEFGGGSDGGDTGEGTGGTSEGAGDISGPGTADSLGGYGYDASDFGDTAGGDTAGSGVGDESGTGSTGGGFDSTGADYGDYGDYGDGDGDGGDGGDGGKAICTALHSMGHLTEDSFAHARRMVHMKSPLAMIGYWANVGSYLRRLAAADPEFVALTMRRQAAIERNQRRRMGGNIPFSLYGWAWETRWQAVSLARGVWEVLTDRRARRRLGALRRAGGRT